MKPDIPIRIVRCPCCGKSLRYDLNNQDRPFCSERCRTYDISLWAEEKFRIPVSSENEDAVDLENFNPEKSSRQPYDDD